MLIIVSLSAIFLGALLLKLPLSTTESMSWMDALFTATSAFTATGLTSVEVGETLTLFGQIVILVLIKLGGIGIVTFAILAFMMLGKKIGFKERLMIQQTLDQVSLGGIIKLVRSIFIYSILIEATATILLTVRWIPVYGFWRGFYYSLFHAVSAFNNAGISVFPNGLSSYTSDPMVSFVMTTLFIIGGLGFTVLIDLKHKRSLSKLSLHSKIMLVGTLVFNLGGTLLFLLLETSNPATLGMLSGGSQVMVSYFQATSTRTAGFNAISVGYFRAPTMMIMLFLMFIGAGSAATSGGIKLTTFFVITLSSMTFIKGRKRVTIGRRTIKEKVVIRSFTILSISILLLFLSLFMLTLTEELPTNKLFFEVVSAFSTAGLSIGVTEDLTYVGRFIMMVLMFFGKVGPLTLAFSLAKVSQNKIIYPSEDILIG